jgi:hypothetical protein
MKSTLGWFARSVSQAKLTGGVLLVLGVLSIPALRDRHRDDSTGQAVRGGLRR